MATERAEKKKGPSCPKCGNHLRLRPDQLGEEVMCPKCNSKFMVGRANDVRARDAEARARAKSKADAAGTPSTAPADALDDAYEPEIPLQRSWTVPESEMADISPLAARPAPYDVDWSVSDDLEVESHAAAVPSEESDYLAVAKAKGLLREPERMRPPKWTFFSGVLGYPWRAVNLSRWTAMGFGLSCAGMMTFATLSNLGFIPGAHGNAVLGIFMSLFAVLMLLGTLSFSAASWDAALNDTADGHDEPQEASLPDWDHWLFSLLAVIGIGAVSAAVGYPLSLVIGPGAFVICGLLVFPVLWLSALECDSYLVPFSPPLLRTLLRRPGTWLMFYLLTTPLLAGFAAAFYLAARFSPYLAIFLSGPIVATLILFYARWLGRVAWSITQLPGKRQRLRFDDESADQQFPNAEQISEAVGRSKRGKKGKKRRKIFIPDALPDAPAPPVASPPPRLRFNRPD